MNKLRIAKYLETAIRLFFLAALFSCNSRYEIENIEIVRGSWENVHVNEKYKIDGFNPFMTKTPKPSKVSIIIVNKDGKKISASTTHTISIPDKELKSREALTLYLETTIDHTVLQSRTTLYSSPKKLEFKPNLSLSSGYSYFINSLQANEVRQVHGSYGNYELIKSDIPLRGKIEVKLIGGYGGSESFYMSQSYPDFSTSFLNNIRKQIYSKHSAQFQFQYSLNWKDEVVTSPTYKETITLSPNFPDGSDGYYWSFDLKPYEAKFFKYYVSSGDLGVFTLKNIGYISDLDIYVYNDSDLSQLSGSSLKGGTQNDLCYVENSGYYYVKVWNNGEYSSKGKLTTHSVDVEDIATSTMSDYFAQQVIKSAIMWIFDIEKDNKVGDHLSDLAANISLSALKGSDSSTLTESALANELCAAFKATTSNRDEANVLCTLAVNIAKEVYKYN